MVQAEGANLHVVQQRPERLVTASWTLLWAAVAHLRELQKLPEAITSNDLGLTGTAAAQVAGSFDAIGLLTGRRPTTLMLRLVEGDDSALLSALEQYWPALVRDLTGPADHPPDLRRHFPGPVSRTSRDKTRKVIREAIKLAGGTPVEGRQVWNQVDVVATQPARVRTAEEIAAGVAEALADRMTRMVRSDDLAGATAMDDLLSQALTRLRELES